VSVLCVVSVRVWVVACVLCISVRVWVVACVLCIVVSVLCVVSVRVWVVACVLCIVFSFLFLFLFVVGDATFRDVTVPVISLQCGWVKVAFCVRCICIILC